MLKGGSWNLFASEARAAHRRYNDQAYHRFNFFGFRPARTVVVPTCQAPTIFGYMDFPVAGYPTASIAIGATLNSGSFTTATVAGNSLLRAQIVNQSGASANSLVHTFALMPAATWDPATQGAVTSLSARYDIRQISSVGTSGTSTTPLNLYGGNAQLAVEQNGFIYAPSLNAPFQSSCGTGACSDWNTVSKSWTAATLGQVNNPIGSVAGVPQSQLTIPPLNLSGTGAPLTFGVLLGFSGGSTSFDSYSFVFDVDNFEVQIECSAP